MPGLSFLGKRLDALLLRPRVQATSRLLPVLVGVLLVLQLVAPYPGWLILLVGLGGAWLIAFLWARSLAGGLQLTREMRFGWAQVGDRLEERFKLTNHGWAPAAWAEVVDHSTLPDYEVARVTGVGGASNNRWYTQGVCTRRGLFTLGPTSLRTGDPFGIFKVVLHYPVSATLLVTPPILPLPSIDVAPGGRAGEGRPRPNALERTASVSTVRDYVPGDDTRWIHWPTSARRGSFYVKLFDGTPAGDWWIFLDLERRVQVGQGMDSTEEHGVMLAASLADRGLRAGHAVGLVAHGEELVWLPPELGEPQRAKILRELALVGPGLRPLSELLARVRPSFRQLASLVIITPNVAGDWIEALLPLVRRGVIPTVLLLDPASFGAAEDRNVAAAELADLGVSHYVIPRELLDRPEARPGQEGRLEWRVLGTGRAVPVRQVRGGWKALS